MNRKVDLFDSTYRHFEADVLARIRRKTFGEDFGQNSWTTADEYRRWAAWLAPAGDAHLLEIASGSGGPAVLLAQLCGCRVTGLDLNAHGVAAARERAGLHNLAERVQFQEADADAPLPFEDGTFDAVICIDSANHFPHRLRVFQEWHRVLRPLGKVLFTDPVVVTGLVSNEELAVRSSIGYFLFSPPGENERLMGVAGFDLVGQEDVTENAAAVSGRWRVARAAEREALLELEGAERYEGLQRFFEVVHRLTSERRLSRIAYYGQRQGSV